jgi:hypothetical protein
MPRPLLFVSHPSAARRERLAELFAAGMSWRSVVLVPSRLSTLRCSHPLAAERSRDGRPASA